MLSNRAAAQLAPILLRGNRVAFQRSARLPRHLPAVAILVPRKALSTETSTGSGESSGPPPGFNLEQAKKPLPKESEKQVSSSKNAEQKPVEQKPTEINIPVNEPSVQAATKASEARSLSE